LKGFARTVGVLRASEAWVGKEVPNLALNPTTLVLSTPFTQFFILT